MDLGEIIAIGLASTALVFNLMGRPAPLSTGNLRRPILYFKRKRSERQEARARQKEQRLQEDARRRYRKEHEGLFANCNRLREMQEGDKQYHGAEWNRQIRLCKESAISMMQLHDVTFTASRRTNGPIILRDPSGSILIDYGHEESHPGQLGVSVDWHPCPSLPFDYMFEIDEIGKPAELFTEWLTEVEAREAGWEEHVSWIRN